MDRIDIFKDISKRTNGDVYLGIVGAVRTGKSTFIKRFMDLVVIPNIQDENERVRAHDELPQSAAGKTIMTTEPKFVPNQAVSINIEEGLDVNIRMVDCVGYAVEGAKGFEDENGPRMIHTPWYEDPIPFHDAAEIGTRKVIQEHSTIGIVITTDGTIGEIPRTDYVEAETKVINELKEVGKPFIMIINSVRPTDQQTELLRQELAEQHDVPVLSMSIESMNEHDVYNVLRESLYEFPVLEVNVNLPSWVMVLHENHWLKRNYEEAIQTTVRNIKRLRDVNNIVNDFSEFEHIDRAQISGMQMGEGIAEIDLFAPQNLYENILKEIVGEEIKGKDHLLALMQDFTHAKREYDQVASALQMVKQTGYGIAAPSIQDMELDEPEIIRQGSRFGVRLKAVAPSIHMIKVEVESEFAPIIGTERQSEELVKYLMQDFEEDPLSIWNSDIFGRSLSSIVREGIQAKISLMPENARYKLKDTLERIINEGSGGLIAIIL
ncbi:stage IV sporulation protein A [Pseudogracilibacillus auburnensis]|uniref:Stage IV sporulation protein A n=1 Tax=Pseudogracilibacillus auburnensis TaxID=1494959 RepID=A0A2V3WIY5_9BACI|nr:stage IV sporulation protein A [Pseudogracilibacillus auburnensis]MBO1003057.1 stage IV sporulation protein A [Pseudogracilibacillus auburnensis]PXW88739.1 stage IV sporulation protein A [Pseudogracilibacillus auburnensis]